MNICAQKGYVRASVTCECIDGGTFSDAGFTPCINRDHAIAARINAAKVPADLLAAMQDDGENGPGRIDWTPPERAPLLEVEPALFDGSIGGVVIIGDINGGKSHTAAWFLRQAVEMGMRARWVTALQLDHEVKDTFGEGAGSRRAVVARYVDVPFLVIDELKAATPFTAEVLGEVIRGRYERSRGDVHPTVITANGCPSKVLEPHVWSRLSAMAPSFQMNASGRRAVAA